MDRSRFAAVVLVVALVGCADPDEPGVAAKLVEARPMAGAPRHPFGAHTSHYTSGALRPSGSARELDLTTARFYDAWKARYLVAGCGPGRYYVAVGRDHAAGGGKDANSISVSEGHGYGMLLAVLMAGHDPAAHQIFDGLFRFLRDHPSRHDPALMGWNQVAGCGPATETGGDESASDGDLDIAYALLLADAQWGSGGIDYRREAQKTLRAILAHEIHPTANYVLLGDFATPEELRYYQATRSSDFMVGHFRAFARASGDARWSRVADQTYRIALAVEASEDADTGLLPDFIENPASDPHAARPHFLEGAGDGKYGYNACRMPWRVGTDWLLSGEPRAAQMLRPLDAWIREQTSEDPSEIDDGYELDGDVVTPDDDPSMAFVAPLGVAAMADPTAQKWLDRVWGFVAGRRIQDDDYYGNTIKLLCMVVMSGNWWAPG